MRYFKLTQWLVLPVIATFLIGVQPAASQTSPLGGATIYDVGCMQDIAGFTLNCNANDIKIAGVAKNADGTDKITITDPCEFPGDEVTFEATFAILSSASRYDIGIYFSTDGDIDGTGALSGECSISTLPYAPRPYLDLDGINKNGTQDLCGDVNKLDITQPYYFHTIEVTTTCVDSDGDEKLNLPYCLSWRTSGNNELCLTPTNAYPGTPSKCNCDKGFNVPVPVPKASLQVKKEAIAFDTNNEHIYEPGGLVTYKVTVTNTGIDPKNYVTLDSLTDTINDIEYDITQADGIIIQSTDCSEDQIICPTSLTNLADCPTGGLIGSYSCEFTAKVEGNAFDEEKDTVTASGVDTRDNTIPGFDDETVTIQNVLPDITVTKTANIDEMLEPGGEVNFTVTITNNSVKTDPVTITSLTDSVNGVERDLFDNYCSVDLMEDGTKVIVIESGEKYECEFSADVTKTETNTVTAKGTDDEGNPFSKSSSWTVTVNDVPSEIKLTKTHSGDVNEPGDVVTYTYKIENTSEVDTVTINSLKEVVKVNDAPFSDPIDLTLIKNSTCKLPKELAPGESFECTVPIEVTGRNAFDHVTNEATAKGIDDDGLDVEDSDSATVNILNVAPTATLTKKATEAVVRYDVMVCNKSEAESLTLDNLKDEINGNIYDISEVKGPITETTCLIDKDGNKTSITLEISDDQEEDGCYSCYFKAIVTESPTTDTVIGEVNDDDKSNPAFPEGSAQVTFGPPNP